jgi:hypothetical protein
MLRLSRLLLREGRAEESLDFAKAAWERNSPLLHNRDFRRAYYLANLGEVHLAKGERSLAKASARDAAHLLDLAQPINGRLSAEIEVLLKKSEQLMRPD